MSELFSRYHPVFAVDDMSIKARAAVRKAFGDRLYQLIVDRGWNRSELGRRAGLPRDAISNYVRGANLPSKENLEAIAHALNMTVEDLAPQLVTPMGLDFGAEDEANTLNVEVLKTDGSRARLRVDRIVSTEVAFQVARLITGGGD